MGYLHNTNTDGGEIHQVSDAKVSLNLRNMQRELAMFHCRNLEGSSNLCTCFYYQNRPYTDF